MDKSNTCPTDYQPDWSSMPLRVAKARIAPEVDIDKQLVLMMLHEFERPKSDWNRVFASWLINARPERKTAEIRGQTVSFEESTNPAVVAERRRRESR